MSRRVDDAYTCLGITEGRIQTLMLCAILDGFAAELTPQIRSPQIRPPPKKFRVHESIGQGHYAHISDLDLQAQSHSKRHLKWGKMIGKKRWAKKMTEKTA